MASHCGSPKKPSLEAGEQTRRHIQSSSSEVRSTWSTSDTQYTSHTTQEPSANDSNPTQSSSSSKIYPFPKVRSAPKSAQDELASPEVQEQLKKTKIAIITAKSAYAFKSDRWLSLLSQAMHEIEQYPEEVQIELTKELRAFHPAWKKRPRSR